MDTACSSFQARQSDIARPARVRGLVRAADQGRDVSCVADPQVIHTDFFHENQWKPAHILLCWFTGTVGGVPFDFRKCYSRSRLTGTCSQGINAVMSANRYLQADYRLLGKAGIAVPWTFFSIQEVLLRQRTDQDTDQDADCNPMTVNDVVQIAREGNEIIVEANLHAVMAIEHYPDMDIDKIYLMADLVVITLGSTTHCKRCLGSYATENEDREKMSAISVANQRLQDIYEQFREAGVGCNECFFDELALFPDKADPGRRPTRL
ncbi:MAG: hypothetical protein R6U41_03020 [Desulfosalsimonas sp.]|uniref:hypothetical protein n=1 Tax=Desulfosalsimonas sp. TaxID=3073848 RepID=UPI003970AA97